MFDVDILAYGIFLLGAGVMVYGYWKIWWLDYKQDMENLKYYKDNFIRKQGWSMGFDHYDVMTFDGGCYWYNVKRDHKGLQVLGPADPELIKHLSGMEKLVNYAKKHGPLFSRQLSPRELKEQAKLLEDAGFKVEMKE